MVICANYDKNHIASSLPCASRHKANVEAQKEKKLRQSNKKKQEKIRSEVGEEEDKREESLVPDMSMNLENEQ